MVEANESRRLVILGTGGTIAGRAARAGDNVGYVAGQVGVADLVAAVPALANVPMQVEQVAQIDSKDMGLPVWQALVARLQVHVDDPRVAAVIVTHGTDTLEETAFVLHRVLQPSKPVVLTCAMRPASALVPDGPQNLADALAVVREAQAGVVVVCAGQVHAASEVAKVHTYRLDAFDSGDAGPLACVEEGEVRRFRSSWSPAPSRDPALLHRFLAAEALPRVELVTSHADADGGLVRALMAPGAARPVRGIVVAGTGNGTVHKDLSDALMAAQAQGVRVVLATRCARGRV
ncbi:asparaginase, partial [Hydrogenophaga sp.]|uniref:asparaginase n=1 Tax=Hydrogenophaga sp. TaxID=1904254 RepID=UPI00260A44F4